MMEPLDYIIVGGGAVGTSALFHLTRDGGGSALLLEKLGGYGRGATGIWGSLVRMFYNNLDTTLAATQSVPFYLDFEREVGVPFEWTRTGSLYFLKRDALGGYAAHLAALEASGLSFEVIAAKDGKTRFPDFAWFEDDVAIYEPSAGIASPRATTEAFLAAAARQGAEARLDAEVVEIVWQGARASGVRTRDGAFHACKTLVICAGIWTNEVLASTPARVAAYPVPIQLNRFYRHQRPLAHPYFIDLAGGTFGHPTPAGSFIGGYQGRAPESDEVGLGHPSPEAANLAKHEIARRIPWVKSATLEGGIQALESYTDASFGLVEQLTGFENVVVSTGWSCAGFTLAPVIGARIAALARGL
ncbi:MAG: hypothetical protein JWM80_721 [Cyanobacteria bacterium RYN_339]|nr:hypothetical protein [Cyanobacteria bacterium RYN_339]